MIDHSSHQTDLSIKMQIYNISVNMARIGNWIGGVLELKRDRGEDVYRARFKLINQMIIQTENYLNDLVSQSVSENFKPTLSKFKQDLKVIKKKSKVESNLPFLAEKALTWADILQIRAKLA